MLNNKFKTEASIGKKIHSLAKKLWSINRSITGAGVRKTLKMLKDICPKIKIYSIPSGTKAFDWVVPNEWNVSEAWVKNSKNKKIINFTNNNLHLVGYSTPINKKLKLSELKKNLYSLKNQPNAIPYITSFYQKRWGFCLTYNQEKKIKPGNYKVYINSKFTKGFLNYGELRLPGKSKNEIFLSTNICHPSLANNELSGPVVTTYICKWLQSLAKKKYSYRIIFVPETIGSIAYLSKNYKYMKKKIVAGFNISCIGDDKNYSFLPSKQGNTLSDEVAKHVLSWTDKNYKFYNWSERGSDERQYCSPGIDLPIASVMRTKYGEYKEYHTSLDNLKNVVTPKGLEGGFVLIKRIIEALENNYFPRTKILCEPQLSKRNLYPTLSRTNSSREARIFLDLISYSDGHTSLLNIAKKINVPIWNLYSKLNTLVLKKIIKI